MYKKLILILFLALGIGLIISLLSKDVNDKKLGANLSLCQSASATSTTVYLAGDGGASTGTASFGTTTLACTTGSSDLVDWNLSVNASSTTGVLYWVWEFSNNQNDWYAEDCNTVVDNNNVTHGSGFCFHKWTLGTTTLAQFSFKNVSVNRVASNYTRLRAWANTASTTLHIQAVKRDRVEF